MNKELVGYMDIILKIQIFLMAFGLMLKLFMNHHKLENTVELCL